MIIGVPKEIKNNENRVGLTPAGVAELRKHGHTLLVQHTAGEGSGFSDDEYKSAGATISFVSAQTPREPSAKASRAPPASANRAAREDSLGLCNIAKGCKLII